MNEIVPGLLFQRANFLNWPRRQKLAMLERHGIRVVVNLWHKADPDLSSEAEGSLIYLNWHIAGDRLPPEAPAFIHFLADLFDAGLPILLHCESGVNRSVWLAAELLREVTGHTGRVALAEVEARVPGHKMNRNLRAALEEDGVEAVSISDR